MNTSLTEVNRCQCVSGRLPNDDRPYWTVAAAEYRSTAALPAATITLCQLHASRRTLAERVARRGRGLKSARGLGGDELIGLPPARLSEIADRAARLMDALDGFGDLRVDTDDRPPDGIAAEILERTGWPSR